MWMQRGRYGHSACMQRGRNSFSGSVDEARGGPRAAVNNRTGPAARTGADEAQGCHPEARRNFDPATVAVHKGRAADTENCENGSMNRTLRSRSLGGASVASCAYLE